MSVSTPPTCALGLSPADLSAWRDGALSLDAAQHIAAHVVNCPACQRINAADNALAAALRADQPPAPDPHNWRLLQARIAARPGRRITAPRRAVWSGLVAAAAVLVISALFLSLFGQLAQRRGASTHRKIVPAATPQALVAVPPTAPVMGSQLHWQNQPAPESIIPPPGNQTYTNGFAFSPTDARTAYICSTTNAYSDGTIAPITIWATHDGAATWTRMSDLPSGGQVAQCMVVVDANDPLRLVVSVSGQDIKTLNAFLSDSISEDGGKTWTTLNGGYYLTGLATRQQTSIALEALIGGVSNAASADGHAHVVLSRDDWRSFEPVDNGLWAQGVQPVRVWQRPGDGALLVEGWITKPLASPTLSTVPTYGSPMAVTLWQSADLGAHWTPLPTPPNLANASGVAVAQPEGNAPWKACGFAESGSGATLSQLIGCTFDGGQTWSARPLPALQQVCQGTSDPACLQLQTVANYGATLLADGSLYATFYTGSTSPNTAQTPDMFHRFRLAPHASQWEDLGVPPSGAVIVIDGATPTIISYSGASLMDGVSGQIVGHLGGDVSNRGVFSIAALP